MADVNIGAKLTLDANDGIKSVKQIRKELQDAKGDLLAMTKEFGAMSDEAALAAKNVAGIEDNLKDAKELVDAFNPETKFRAFSSALNTVVGGFSAVQGAMGLIGVESENVQKSLLKVQSALALSQGVAQLQEGIKSFKTLAAVIQQTTVFQKLNNAATVIATTVQKAFGVAVTTTSTGFKVLKTAIIATGIGALVVLIGSVVSAIMDWTSSTDDAADAQKRLESAIDGVNDSLNNQLEDIDTMSKREIARLKIAGADRGQIFDAETKALEKRTEAYQQAYDQQFQIFREAEKKFTTNSEEHQAERAKAEKAWFEASDNLERAKNARIQFGLDFRVEQAEKERSRLKVIADKAAAEAKARREQEIKEQIEENNRLAARRAEGISGGARITALPGATIEEQTIERVAATNKKFREQMAEDDAIYTNDYIEQIEARKANEEAAYQSRVALANATMNLLSSVSSLIGKETAAGKVLAIAQATINTFVGATEVLRSKSVLPEPIGTISKIANVAAVIATGMAAIKNIVKTPVPGAGGGAVPTVSAPLLATGPQSTRTQLDQQSLNAIGNAASRAFVVESDVTNNQERIRRLNRAARI